jgi:predicted nicotinamide N-methyase
MAEAEPLSDTSLLAMELAPRHGPLAVVERSSATTLQLDLAVVLHDGTADVLLEKGTSLPAEGAVLLTTTTAQQRYLGLELVQGLRPIVVGLGTPQGSHTRVASLQVPVPRVAEGCAQVLLKVLCEACGAFEIVATDMLSGRVTKKDITSNEVGPLTSEASAPARWKFFPRGSIAGDGPTKHPGFTFAHTFLPIQQNPVDLPEGHKDVEVDPALTAGRIWPAAYDTARYLERCGVEGARVLELGAGLGLVGLACAVGGASHVCLTDLGENLPGLMAEAERVAVSAKLDVGESSVDQVRIAPLDWYDAPAPGVPWGTAFAQRKARKLLEAPWDVVIASDCVFWEELFDPLLSVLLCLTTPPHPDIIDRDQPPPQLLGPGDEGEEDLGAWHPPEVILLSFVPRLARVWSFLHKLEEHFILEDVTRQFANDKKYYASGTEISGPLEPRIFALTRRIVGEEASYIKPSHFPSVILRSPDASVAESDQSKPRPQSQTRFQLSVDSTFSLNTQIQ